jgi:hypothetical protein
MNRVLIYVHDTASEKLVLQYVVYENWWNMIFEGCMVCGWHLLEK